MLPLTKPGYETVSEIGEGHNLRLKKKILIVNSQCFFGGNKLEIIIFLETNSL